MPRLLIVYCSSCRVGHPDHRHYTYTTGRGVTCNGCGDMVQGYYSDRPANVSGSGVHGHIVTTTTYALVNTDTGDVHPIGQSTDVQCTYPGEGAMS